MQTSLLTAENTRHPLQRDVGSSTVPKRADHPTLVVHSTATEPGAPPAGNLVDFAMEVGR
ncbi:hypothetical protein GCM10009634_25530 [Saccharothrix xinjiangensis]